jgi:carboxypeptidase Q
VFKGEGIQFTSPTSNTNATAVIQAIGKLLISINGSAVSTGGEGTDIDYWLQRGVPGLSLLSDNHLYFNYHHSKADTMTVLNPDYMDLSTAIWTVYAYLLADMEQMIPR